VVGDSDQASVSVSKQATIRLDSAPSGSANLSLWQANLTGLLVERVSSWAPIHSVTATAAIITGATYPTP
jgi:hypothetical protein